MTVKLGRWLLNQKHLDSHNLKTTITGASQFVSIEMICRGIVIIS